MKELEKEIKEIEDELFELLKNIPAHSMKPSHLIKIEELEERLKKKREELKSLQIKEFKHS